MASVYDIVKGINQAAANAYDGTQIAGYNADDKAIKIGLKREKGNPITDSRVMDGFKVRIGGTKLIVSYQTELPMSAVHNTKIDEEIEQTYADIIKFLKKEYKSITKDTLRLKDEGPCKIILQNMSRVRTWAECEKIYTIQGLKDVVDVGEPSEEGPEKRFKDFLKQGGLGKRPKNDKRKKSE